MRFAALVLLLLGGERVEPAGDLNPTVVTQRLVRKVASGEWPLARFIDPKRGVVIVEFFEDVAEQEPQFKDGMIKRSRRLCGDEIGKRAREIRGWLESSASLGDLRCRNRLSADADAALDDVDRADHECHGGGYDLAPMVHLIFTVAPDKGIVLDTIVAVQGGGVASWRKVVDRWVHKKLEAERGKTCADRSP